MKKQQHNNIDSPQFNMAVGEVPSQVNEVSKSPMETKPAGKNMTQAKRSPSSWFQCLVESPVNLLK